MNDTRTLIKENIALGHEIASDLVQYKTPLADLKRAYEALDLGPLTNDIFKTLILTGTKNTVAFYITTLNSQLDKINIVSKIMRENAISDHDKIIEDLNKAVAAVKTFRPELPYSRSISLPLRFISFTDRFIVTDEDFEAILENFCRAWISEEEKPILDLAEELMKSYNKFLDFVDEQKLMRGNTLNCLELIFNEDSERKACIDASKLKSLITYKQRYADFNNTKLM